MSSEQHFQKAKEYSERGDSYANEGNFEYSSKCYAKVAQIMNYLRGVTKSSDMLQVLKNKAIKFEKLSLEMGAKDAQKRKEAKKKPTISKFGFPEPQRNTINSPVNNFSMKPREPIIQNQNQSFPNNEMKRQQNPDKQVAGLIINNINVGFDDIVGMQEVKQILYESVIYPKMRPDLFQGIRSPPRGILMYGPPGNGKTLMAKALAKQSGCVFYNLSAASIMNKFVGESQKMLRRVFESAHKTSPSIIFIDEIDSMLTARSQNQNDSSRRLKTQYLVQFDGVTTSKQSHVIVIGATNLPNQIDLAALRRFNKLVYVGLPTLQTRQSLITHSLKQIANSLSKKELKKISQKLEGYSASEIKDIVKQVCMEPIRELKKNILETITKSNLRKVEYKDFERIIEKRKPLLSKQDLAKYDAKFH